MKLSTENKLKICEYVKIKNNLDSSLSSNEFLKKVKALTSGQYKWRYLVFCAIFTKDSQHEDIQAILNHYSINENYKVFDNMNFEEVKKELSIFLLRK